MAYIGTGIEVSEEYSVSIDYIKKRCWEELQEFRMTTKETLIHYHAIQYCEGYSNLNDEKLKNLMFKIRIYEK